MTWFVKCEAMVTVAGQELEVHVITLLRPQSLFSAALLCRLDLHSLKLVTLVGDCDSMCVKTKQIVIAH